ncbi:hypothetical protein HGO23_04620 [Xenorhabdus budapestensis]|uniref:DUF3990 domain-containing protein n=1 Tax=Xenorhabdus budapestensis TaxID=290110 RepID=A0ABX7VIS4_XENBU|nr:hypothetical protein [Xenorhabdus budapestensis]QTL40664.1 hypothetical protein HGO23_04620 [Xenorhabdus budapestensis]
MKLIGFHGTDANNEASILGGNFRVSAKDDEWLGTGAYFFVEGLGDPQKNAEDWARLQAWNNKKKLNNYSEFVVLSVEIIVQKALELDTNEGLQAFEIFRTVILTRMRKQGIQKSKSLLENDCTICNLIMAQTDFDAIIRNEYIKLDKFTRIIKYQSRIPNCRIVSVKNPTKSINKGKIKSVIRGLV